MSKLISVSYKEKFFLVVLILFILFLFFVEYKKMKEFDKVTSHKMSMIYSLGSITVLNDDKVVSRTFLINWLDLKKTLEKEDVILKYNHKFLKNTTNIEYTVNIYLNEDSYKKIDQKVDFIKQLIQNISNDKISKLNDKSLQVSLPTIISISDVEEKKYSFNIYFILSILFMNIFLIFIFLVIKKDVEYNFVK